MGEGEAEEFGGDRVGFGVIECGKAGDKKSQVGGVVVFYAEAVYHQDEGHWASGVTEKAGSLGLVEVEGL